MIPAWLTYLSLASIALAILCALWIAVDVRRHPAKMAVMNVVWPVCALFGSVLMVWFYLRYGRNTGGDDEPPYPVIVAKGTLHCGAGCSLGDIMAETLALWLPAVLIPLGFPGLFGEEIFAIWILDYIFAYAIGVAFQYYAIAPMRNLGPREGIWAAAKADTFSLTSWQIGMYGLMAIAYFWLFPTLWDVTLKASMPAFWLVMQFAMLAGFVTSYPVNWWLISAGLKERM